MSPLKGKIIYIILCFSSLLNACEELDRQPGNLNTFAPKVVKATAPEIRVIKIPPEVIHVKNVQSKTAGKPKIVHLNSNVHKAGTPKVISAGKPVICTPGNDSFKLPKVVPASGKTFLTGLPEVFDTKEPFIKDKNPSGISSFKVLQGLKTNNIFPMIQDKAGNIWISTWEAGVSRYDGGSFTHYTTRQGLSNDNVWSMLEDSKGNIWFGTIGGGLNKYDGRSFTHYTTREGMSDNDVISIMEDKKGNLWFGTAQGGVDKYDGKSFIHYTTEQGLIDNNVRSIIQDINGNIWFGSNNGMSKFDGKSFSNYTTDQGLNSNNIWCIAEDKDGNLWISSWGNGIDKYDGKSFMHYSSAEGLSSDNVWKILEDKDGNLWIGTIDKGVNKFDGKSFTYFDIEQGLSNNVIHSILEDKSGNIWIGTDGGGVNKYDGGSFSHYHHTQGLTAGNISCTMEDKNGNIWIGTNEQGLNKYDGNTISQYTVSQGLSSNNFISIKEDTKGNIWFCTWGGGVDKYDGKSFTNYSVAQGLNSDAIYSMIEDTKGNLWFGTSAGLCEFDGKSFTRFDTTQGLTHLIITSIAEDKTGNLWMGTYGGGINKYDGKSIAAYTTKQGLSSNDILSIYADSHDNIWVGTYDNGVNKFDGEYFTQYTTADGLSNNSVGSIREDHSGNMWFLSRNGLCTMQSSKNGNFKRANAGNSQSPLFKNYLLSDGFLGVGSDYNTLTSARDGKIWAGAVDRLTCYNPEKDVPDTIPPNIQLRSISIFNENINWLDLEKNKDTILLLSNGVGLKDFEFSGLSKWYYLPENLKLAYDNNYLTFRFVGITTKRTQHVKYQYSLQGLDKHWSSLTTNPEAIYNVLPPGSYTFKVKAVNSEGYWSGEFAYSFTILSPWWENWWAYMVYIPGFAFIIWLFIWYRSRRLKVENLLLEEKVIVRTHELEQSMEEKFALAKKVESQHALLNERLRISRELHDDIGSTLSSISIYSEVAKKRTEKNENTNDVLSKIGNASRELIDKMSDIVWSLNPNNESFEQLQHRMMAFAALILSPQNIIYDFVADDELKKLHFKAGEPKNIFLIFKEALHNIVKYADCTTVRITLSVQKNDLTMIIQDNGRGFDFSQTTSNEICTAGEYLGGNGIKNMTARAGDINAKICISSKIEEGTTVQLTVLL
ncbi:MAG: two-component regulator propeller domain-containing protein [Ginsengibacter sp.]